MIDRLCLGTVQFGMLYGVNNKFGKPSKNETFEMLDIAFNKGIDIIDTAAAYGNAEELIGEYLLKNSFRKNIKVITKLLPNILDSCTNINEKITGEVKNSLQTMGIEQLEGYMLHTPSYVYNSSVIESLNGLKKSGLIKNIGVSIYDMEDALYAVNKPDIDFIQIPYSVFDQRADDTNFFSDAKNNKKTVFARSAFLQGLLMMGINELPLHLDYVSPHLMKLYDLCNQYRLSVTEAAISFTLSNRNIDYLVFGVDSQQQLKEDISITETIKDNSEINEAFRKEFKNMDKKVIFPSLWTKI